MKRSIVMLCLLFSVNCFAQLNIMPAPAEVKMGKGIYTINKNTKIIASGLSEKFGTLLNDFIFSNYGFKLETIAYSKKDVPNSINFVSDGKLYGAGIGVYVIKITDNGILIGAGTPQGFFYGIQTLFQLLPLSKNNPTVSQLYISDYPRFPYRGMHLDVSRHFYPVAFIKKYIDYLAAYKYNKFHWHLTDDQGWRIEIKKYPLLTQVGGFRNGTIIGRHPGKGNDSTGYGGFYTQQQIKEIVKYAADRYIDVIPEIELPGHASAAIAAYPQLSCFPDESTKTGATPWAGSKQGKQVQQTWGVFEDVFCPSEYTFNFLQDVLDEVMQLFPSKYIHIGGDECPKEAWKKSTFCQQLIAANNLKDEHGLQSYFISHIEKYINNKGKKIIGWDEILEGGLAPNATVMSWRGEEGGIEAAKQRHDVIMTPGTYCYLDHSQSKNEDSVTIGGYLPLEKVYNYEPIPAVLSAEEAKHVLGAQGNVWTEYMNNTSKVEYMIFPRMMALSEVLWTPKKKRNWSDFERRLPIIFEKLDKEKTNYSKAYYDLQATVLPTEDFNGILWKLESKMQNAHINFSSDNKSTNTLYDSPIKIIESGKINASLTINGKETGSAISQKFSFNKATGKKITLISQPGKSYPGDGAFTLVNGVQNEKGLAKSNEFLGFLGTDLDAIIDLKTITDINKITLHVFDQTGSWIYLPQQVEITYIPDVDYTEEQLKSFPKEIKIIDPIKDKGLKTIVIASKQQCRYISVLVKNFGTIPQGNPGAGNPAWLFADEIEVE
jgi:hexosaminidase